MGEVMGMALTRYNAQRTVNRINRDYPVGTTVRYTSADWTGGETVVITSPAYVQSGHPWIRFEGIRSAWHCKFIEPVKGDAS
jgi:hypothetical protein